MTNPPNAVHHSAEQGYTPAAADLYVRGRPDYPPEVNAWLRETLGLAAGATVVDLGAGTGKFTRRLLETGAHVIAVEPVAAMRAKLAAALPEVDTRAGTAEALPLDDASVEAVVCAQAFHWFANAASLAEILRVLKPGGRLGLIWNLRDASVEWVARLDAIVNRAEGDTPRYYTGQWRNAFPFAGFGPLHEQRFMQGHTGSPEDVIIARVKSTSFIAALPSGEQARIEAELRALIDSEPQLRGKTLVTVPYGTAAFHCVKQP
ncbi:class I SAM-dependent methyltransferase [Paraburkholderia sp. J76]|uniref:class I SAM-dependent methyltransferase n=1 Tax=Paraburkholderia sp. J76 TaxID=2805439 RepID=UPI002ABE0F86|nr:class I SAM-dependent methyltransferase [Paraburkholderia sp. J76]